MSLTPKSGASGWLPQGSAGRYSQASSSSSPKDWAASQTMPATRASVTYLPTTLLEILAARPTALVLSPACKLGRKVSRICRIVILLVGIGSDRKKR